jgi:hypothetical protein
MVQSAPARTRCELDVARAAKCSKLLRRRGHNLLVPLARKAPLVQFEEFVGVLALVSGAVAKAQVLDLGVQPVPTFGQHLQVLRRRKYSSLTIDRMKI